MPLLPVTDPAERDRLLRDYRDLKDVALRSRLEPAGGLYIAESLTVLRRAMSAGHRPRSVLTAPRWLPELAAVIESEGAGQAVPLLLAEEDALAAVAGYRVHRGTLAAMHRPALPAPEALLAGARRVVVLDALVDHTNVGAIFRSAAALGADAVLVTPECADPLYRRSVRVSMGTVFQVPWSRLPEWPEAGALLRAAGLEVLALALADDAVPLDAIAPDGRYALVFGAEGDGLGRQALAGADRVVTIPMAGGVDSLNVAAATAVVLWQLRG